MSDEATPAAPATPTEETPKVTVLPPRQLLGSICHCQAKSWTSMKLWHVLQEPPKQEDLILTNN